MPTDPLALLSFAAMTKPRTVPEFIAWVVQTGEALNAIEAVRKPVHNDLQSFERWLVPEKPGSAMLKIAVRAVVLAIMLTGCTPYAQQRFDQDIEDFGKADYWKLKPVDTPAKPAEGSSGSSTPR